MLLKWVGIHKEEGFKKTREAGDLGKLYLTFKPEYKAKTIEVLRTYENGLYF